MDFLSVWYPELLLVGIFLLVGLGSAGYAYWKKRPVLLLGYGASLSVIAGVFSVRGMATYWLLLAAGILLFALGIALLLRGKGGDDQEDARGQEPADRRSRAVIRRSACDFVTSTARVLGELPRHLAGEYDPLDIFCRQAVLGHLLAGMRADSITFLANSQTQSLDGAHAAFSDGRTLPV
jgi:hypothetical protein